MIEIILVLIIIAIVYAYSDTCVLIDGGNERYPYWRDILKNPPKLDRIGKMIKVRNFNPKIKHLDITYPINYKGQPMNIFDMNYNYNSIITDYFVEPIRITLPDVKTGKSTLDDYNGEKVETIRQKFDMLSQKSYSPAVFPVNIAYWFYKHFSACKILDMSAGWGDRLVASMVRSKECDHVTYYGVDPNPNMTQKYHDIVQHYKPQNFDYKIIPKKFEDTELSEFDGIEFDIMFSSPPYFVSEKYFEDIDTYGDDVDTWLNTFMFPSIDKIVTMTKYIAIVLNDTPDVKYMQKIIDYLSSKFTFEGIITITFGTRILYKTTQPCFVFKKK